MRKILVTTVLVLLMASSGAAKTERGSVNTAKTDMYFWLADGGQSIITMMWLNGGADLFMVLVCDNGVDDPITFGVAAGSLKKFARINAGIPAGAVCGLGVSAIRNGSQYFASFLAETDGVANGYGRQSALPPHTTDGVAAVLEQQVERVRRASR